jgi:hypothetical protein
MPFVLIAGWVLSVASAAHAQVVLYDNLANTTQGFRSVDEFNWEAERFNTDSNNLMLTSATLRFFSQNGGTGTFFLKLFSDNAGQPGTALATLASGPNPLSGLQGDVTFSGLNQLLSANTNYWIVFGDNPGPSLDLRWGVANPGGSGVGFQNLIGNTGNQGTSWGLETTHAMQMQLTGSVFVPEPGSMALGLIGAGGMWFARRAKNRPQFRTENLDSN